MTELAMIHMEMSPFDELGGEDALRAFADALPDGLFTTDLQGRVTFWNKAAERITGWSREDALGRSCALLAGDAMNGCSCGAGPTRCGIVERGFSSRCCNARTKDGRHVLLVKKAVPLYTRDRRLVGALETFTDIGTAVVEQRECGGVAAAVPAMLGLVGASEAMRDVNRTISLFAHSDSNVLIQGESGTGKEKIAEAIHAQSKRARHRLARVGCSTVRDDALEAELFGSGDGRNGALHEAEDGTLLLDEIGDASHRVQGKLLRAVQERTIESAGAAAPGRRGARIVCTTHHDLRRLVEGGRFRADLFFRISALTLEVPPLRARHGDLALLADAFLGGIGGGRGRDLAPDAVQALESYAWPGNVRELQNVLEYATLRSGGAPITREHLPPRVTGLTAGRAASRVAADADAIRCALSASRGNRAEAARRLGISRVTLWKRIKEFGLCAFRRE